MKKQLDLLLDVDGVLRDTYRTVFDIYKRDFDPESGLNYIDLNVHNLESQLVKVYDHFPDLYAFFTHYGKEIYQESLPLERDIAEHIKEIQKLADIHIVSYQFNGNQKFTDIWLSEHGVFEKKTYTNDKWKVNGDLLLDDSLHQLFTMENFGSATPICFWQKYNRDWPHQDREVKSLAEVPALIEELYR